MSMEHESLRTRLELYRSNDPDPDFPEVESLREELSRSPELRQRLAQINAFDNWAGQVIRDVTIPAGLEQRILAKIVPSSPGQTANRGGETNKVIEKSGAPWMLLVSSMASLAAIVLVALFLWPNPRAVSYDEIAIEARAILDRAKSANFTVQHPTTALPVDWPADFDAKFMTGSGTEKFLEHKARMFRLKHQNRTMVLLVVPRDAFGSIGGQEGTLPVSGISIHIQSNAAEDNMIVFISEEAEDYDVVRISSPLT